MKILVAKKEELYFDDRHIDIKTTAADNSVVAKFGLRTEVAIWLNYLYDKGLIARDSQSGLYLLSREQAKYIQAVCDIYTDVDDFFWDELERDDRELIDVYPYVRQDRRKLHDYAHPILDILDYLHILVENMLELQLEEKAVEQLEYFKNKIARLFEKVNIGTKKYTYTADEENEEQEATA